MIHIFTHPLDINFKKLPSQHASGRLRKSLLFNWRVAGHLHNAAAPGHCNYFAILEELGSKGHHPLSDYKKLRHATHRTFTYAGATICAYLFVYVWTMSCCLTAAKQQVPSSSKFHPVQTQWALPVALHGSRRVLCSTRPTDSSVWNLFQETKCPPQKCHDRPEIQPPLQSWDSKQTADTRESCTTAPSPYHSANTSNLYNKCSCHDATFIDLYDFTEFCCSSILLEIDDNQCMLNLGTQLLPHTAQWLSLWWRSLCESQAGNTSAAQHRNHQRTIRTQQLQDSLERLKVL